MGGERKEDVENLGENRSKTGCLNDGFPFFDCWERTLLQMASSFAKDGKEITSLTGWREDGSGYSICLGNLGSLDFASEEKGKGEFMDKMRNMEIHNGKLVARYEKVAEENGKLRLRIEELERREKRNETYKMEMFEEFKLKIENSERLEKDRFEELKLRDVENQNLVEELGRVRSQQELTQEQWEKKVSDLSLKIIRAEEEIVRLGKQHEKAMEEKVIADGIAKAKEEIIVRNREMEEKLQAEIVAMNGLVEELQREQLSSVQRMADPERVNGEEKTEVAPDETATFVFGDRKPEREKVVEGTGKVFEQKTIPGELKEAIRSYEEAIRNIELRTDKALRSRGFDSYTQDIRRTALDHGIISG